MKKEEEYYMIQQYTNVPGEDEICISSSIFAAGLVTKAKNWNQSKGPGLGRWLSHNQGGGSEPNP